MRFVHMSRVDVCRNAICTAAAAAALLLAAPARAQAPALPGDPAALERVYACRTIEDAAERLACFDAAVGSLRQAQEAGDFAAIDRAQAVQLDREAFGFNLPSLPRLAFPTLGGARSEGAPDAMAGGVEAVSMTIDRVVMRPDGHALFIMTNGQHWVQVDQERTRSVRPGGAVTVRRAALGSFLMRVEAGGPAHRVRRER